MQRLLIDTNVVLSYLTDRNANQQATAADWFNGAAAGTLRLVLHQNVLVEFVYVSINLYKLSTADVAAAARDLTDLPGVESLDALDYDRLWRLWPAHVRDFGDAVLTTVAASQRLTVATFDRRLRRQLRALNIDTT